MAKTTHQCLQAAWGKLLGWVHCSGTLLRLQVFCFCFCLDLSLIYCVHLPSASLPSSLRVMLLLEFLPSHTFQFFPRHFPSDPLESRQLLSLFSAGKLSGPQLPSIFPLHVTSIAFFPALLSPAPFPTTRKDGYLLGTE